MASSTYGVTSTGFIRPTEAEIAQEIIDCFPDDLEYTSGCYETNLLEAMTKLRKRWLEKAECDFNTQNNYCLATGCQLDAAIEFMGYSRLDGEEDIDLIARVKAAEASGSGGFETILENKIRGLDAVCRVRVYTPKDASKTGNQSCEVETVVQGGDKEAIALAIHGCSGGLTNVGDTLCRVEDSEGICREVSFTIATEVEYCVRMFVKTYGSNCGCDNQTFDSISQNAFDIMNSKDICDGIGIGGTVYRGMFCSKGIEIAKLQFAPALYDADGNCICDQQPESAWIDGPLTLGCREVLKIKSLDCICPIAMPGSV